MEEMVTGGFMPTPWLPKMQNNSAIALSTLPSVPIVVKPAPRSNAGRKPAIKPGINDRGSVPVSGGTMSMAELMTSQIACMSCNAPMIDMMHDAQRGDVVCSKCGVVDNTSIIVEENEMTIRSINRGERPAPPARVRKSSTGQKYNHMSNFSEILTQLQGLENITCIRPPVTLESILASMRVFFSSKNIQLQSVTPVHVHSYLKANNIPSLYKHIVKLAHMITGKTAPALSPQQLANLTSRFQQFLIAWNMLKKQSKFGLRDNMHHFSHPIVRKNVIAYRFVIFKLCELENIPDICGVSFLPRIPKKVAALDFVWKHVCRHTGFQYIQTSHIHAHYK